MSGTTFARSPRCQFAEHVRCDQELENGRNLEPIEILETLNVPSCVRWILAATLSGLSERPGRLDSRIFEFGVHAPSSVNGGSRKPRSLKRLLPT